MFEKFLVDDSGQGVVEYALVVAFVSVTALASMRMLGTMVSAAMSTVAREMSS
jgi:Flp pilus assembly pilin Flp